MAGLAARSQRVLVLVVLLVARHTGNACVFEGGRQVALLAFHTDMLAQQRKAGKPVVDLGGFPVTLVVTGCAFLAFLALVLVVLLVTGDARRLQLFLV